MSSNVQRLVVPRGVERQLLLAYLAIFSIILAALALLAHSALAVILDRENADRLSNVARVGQSVVDATASSFTVDLADQTVRSIDMHTEGLQWFDASGHIAAAVGLMPSEGSRTLTLPVVIGTRSPREVFVRAVLSREPYESAVNRADGAIGIALALAIVCSLVAGHRLSRRLMQRIEANMQMIAEFAANAAHELRGPLTAVVTNAAHATPADNGSLIIDRRSLDSIHSATAQMVRLTDDLLTLTRAGQPLERELFAVDLDKRVVAVIDLYRAQAQQRKVALVVDTAAKVRVYGNPDQIDQIVGNLVQNAIRFSNPGGEVAVRCSTDRTHARVAVTDTGIGIASPYHEQIFERFWRAEPSRTDGSGSGLGLTIARELARRHGGDISVSSRPGAGSTFVAIFPLKPPI